MNRLPHPRSRAGFLSIIQPVVSGICILVLLVGLTLLLVRQYHTYKVDFLEPREAKERDYQRVKSEIDRRRERYRLASAGDPAVLEQVAREEGYTAPNEFLIRWADEDR